MFSTGIVSNIIKRWELKTNELWVAVKWVSWRRFYARRACVVCATVGLIMEFSFLKQKSYILSKFYFVISFTIIRKPFLIHSWISHAWGTIPNIFKSMNVNKKSYEIVDVKDLNAIFSNNVNLDCFSFYGIVLVFLIFCQTT